MSDHYGIIFNWWRVTPVYHGFNDDRSMQRHDDGGSRDYSRCGLLVSEYVDGRLRQPGDWIPLRHAEKVGRPCAKCFPQGPVA